MKFEGVVGQNPAAALLKTAALRPEWPALVVGSKVWSYQALAELVHSQASRILEVVGQRRPRVVTYHEKGVGAYVNLFATALLGGTHSFLRFGQPDDLTKRALELFCADIIYSGQPASGNPLGNSDAPVIVGPPKSNSTRVEAAITWGGYVAFTSGSTGLPKGVVIPGEALENYLTWTRSTGLFGPGRRVSQHPDLAFDLSVLDTLSTLTQGGALYPVLAKRDKWFPGRFIDKSGINTWVSVPSVIDQFMQDSSIPNLSSVRDFVFCGEPLLPRHLDTLFSSGREPTVWNLYGPTETTVSCTAQIIRSSDAASLVDQSLGAVSVGSAIPGTAVEIHPDTHEIIVSGSQVASGYIGATDNDAERFQASNSDGDKSFRTGDVGIFSNERLFVLGRLDRQIKRRGHRIEPSQIEFVLGKALAAGGGVVVEDSEKNLVFVYECTEVREDSLREIAARELPDYCRPNYFVRVSVIPLNSNGKIDFRKLSEIIEL